MADYGGSGCSRDPSLQVKVMIALLLVLGSNWAALGAEPKLGRPQFPLQCKSGGNHLYEALSHTVLALPPSNLIASLSSPLNLAPASPGRLNPPDDAENIGCYNNPSQITGIDRAELYLVSEKQRWTGVSFDENELAVREIKISGWGYFAFSEKSVVDAICNKSGARINQSQTVRTCLYPVPLAYPKPGVAISVRIDNDDRTTEKAIFFNCPPGVELGAIFPCNAGFKVIDEISAEITFYPSKSANTDVLIQQVHNLVAQVQTSIRAMVVDDYQWRN